MRTISEKRTRKRRVGRPSAGHVQQLVQLRPDQRAALLALAEKRREVGRPPPLSEVVRDILDKALRLEPGRK